MGKGTRERAALWGLSEKVGRVWDEHCRELPSRDGPGHAGAVWWESHRRVGPDSAC